MRKIIVPWWRCANSQLNSAVRAPPTWRYPVGEGAKRRRTSGLEFAGVELMDDGWDYPLFPFSRFSIFAQVSRNGTVRLKTSAPGFESGSTQKYPSRSNWQRSPGFALASDGSSLAFVNTSSDLGLRLAVNSCPSGTSVGSSLVNRFSYKRTSASIACSAETQWMVPFTLRPSGALPLRVSVS